MDEKEGGGGSYEGEWKNGHLPPPKKRPKSRPLTPEAPFQPPPPPGTVELPGAQCVQALKRSAPQR